MQKKLETYDVFLFSLLVGVVAAVFLLFFLTFFYTFHFISFHPFPFAEKFIVKDHWFMHILYYSCLFILYCIGSVLLSIVYFLLLRKRKEWQIGVLYGIGLWVIAYILLPFLMVDELFVLTTSVKMTVTTLCVSVLYGLFVGYSISYYDQSVTVTVSS